MSIHGWRHAVGCQLGNWTIVWWFESVTSLSKRAGRWPSGRRMDFGVMNWIKTAIEGDFKLSPSCDILYATEIAYFVLYFPVYFVLVPKLGQCFHSNQLRKSHSDRADKWRNLHARAHLHVFTAKFTDCAPVSKQFPRGDTLTRSYAQKVGGEKFGITIVNNCDVILISGMQSVRLLADGANELMTLYSHQYHVASFVHFHSSRYTTTSWILAIISTKVNVIHDLAWMLQTMKCTTVYMKVPSFAPFTRW